MKNNPQIEQLAQMVQRGFEEMKGELRELKNDMEHGFAEVNRRIDSVVQPQLDEHAHRIKRLEERVS